MQHEFFELQSEPMVSDHPDFLLIGDGKNKLNISDLSVMRDRIDSDTAVIISAHGSVFRNKHSTHLFSTSTYTEYLLETIQSLNPTVKHNIFLHSCFTSYAAKDAWKMRDGSVLVTYSKELVYENIFRSLKKFVVNILQSDDRPDPVKVFMNDLYDHLYDELAFTFVSSEKRVTKFVLIKMGYDPYHYVKKTKTFAIAPDLKNLLVSGEDILKEKLLEIQKDIGQEYQIFFENALSSLHDNFLPYLAKLLIYYVYRDQVQEFADIINFCRSYNNGTYLDEILHYQDEFFYSSAIDVIKYQQNRIFAEKINMTQEIFYHEPILFDELHGECLVL